MRASMARRTFDLSQHRLNQRRRASHDRSGADAENGPSRSGQRGQSKASDAYALLCEMPLRPPALASMVETWNESGGLHDHLDRCHRSAARLCRAKPQLRGLDLAAAQTAAESPLRRSDDQRLVFRGDGGIREDALALAKLLFWLKSDQAASLETGLKRKRQARSWPPC